MATKRMPRPTKVRMDAKMNFAQKRARKMAIEDFPNFNEDQWAEMIVADDKMMEEIDDVYIAVPYAKVFPKPKDPKIYDSKYNQYSQVFKEWTANKDKAIEKANEIEKKGIGGALVFRFKFKSPDGKTKITTKRRKDMPIKECFTRIPDEIPYMKIIDKQKTMDDDKRKLDIVESQDVINIYNSDGNNTITVFDTYFDNTCKINPDDIEIIYETESVKKKVPALSRRGKL